MRPLLNCCEIVPQPATIQCCMEFRPIAQPRGLDTILDQIDRLPDEQQEMLTDILRGRRIDHERRELAKGAREALALFRAGELRASSVDEVIASLDKALSKPESE